MALTSPLSLNVVAVGFCIPYPDTKPGPRPQRHGGPPTEDAGL